MAVKPPDRHVILDGDVAGQGGVVGQDHLPAGLAVVGDVAIGHEEILLPHLGDAAAEARPPVDGDKLPDDGPPSDPDVGFLPLELDRLGRGPDGGELEDPAVLPDGRVGIDGHMGADDRAGPDDDLFTDDGIGADGDAGIDLRFGVDDGCGMYHDCSPMEASTSASATRFPSTVATPESFAALPRDLIMSISSISWSPGTTGWRNLALSMPMK